MLSSTCVAKRFVSYVTQTTNNNGTTHFILAQGLYTLRLVLRGLARKTVTLNVTEDRLWTFTIHRQVVHADKPMEIGAVEIFSGLIIGYLIHAIEKRKRKPFES